MANNQPPFKAKQTSPKTFGNNPPKKQNLSLEASYYQGVIPPPQMMEHYAQIDPSFPSRILAMAEAEGKSRRDNNDSIIRKSFYSDIISNLSGLLAVALIIWLCYQYLKSDEAEYGKDIAITVIIGLAGIFVLKKIPKSSKSSKEKESE